MFLNYLIVAWRNLRKQRIFSLINLLGMAVGMAGFILFAQMAGSKLHADRFHRNADRICGLVRVSLSSEKKEQHSAFLPIPALAALRSEFPEIEDGTRALSGGRLAIDRGDEAFSESRVLFVDPSFLTVFSFEMAVGDPKRALEDPRSIVLSERAASKYFGDEAPLGRVLTIGGNVGLTVTGVIRNLPRTSSLRFDFLVPIETARGLIDGFDSWRANPAAVFVLLRKGADRVRLEEKLPAFLEKYFENSPDSPMKLYLMPFLDFRLKSSHIESILPSSLPQAVHIPFFLGAILLLVVSINFINLANARNMHRLKEIGLRKSVGAKRSQIFIQLLGESMLLALLAVPPAILFYELVHPAFYAYMAKAIPTGEMAGVSNSILNYPYLLKYLLAAALLTGLFSGFFPALALSSRRPAQILKGALQTGRKKRRGYKFMIVTQFTLAVLFMTIAGVVRSQFATWVKADFGYSRENLAILRIPDGKRPSLEPLKTEIARHPRVLEVSASANLPLVWSENRPARPAGSDPEEAVTVDAYGVDYGFVEALEMEVKKGRSFSREMGDGANYIVNEAAAARLPWPDPLGQLLTVGDRTGMVVGVVKNFLFDDIGFHIPPAVLYVEPGRLNVVLVKYSPAGGFPAIREFLKQKWAAFAPDLPFDCTTLDDEFHAFFDLLGRLASFLNAIGLVTVFFACLGLLGLAAFMVERRTKEIGIRKVLGGSLSGITWTITREYLVLVGIANVLGIAFIFIGWKKVMQTGLLFLADIGPGTYALSVFVSVAAALAAVTSQTWRAAQANPVESLKVE
jgi:putative ABC transport system permease protein